MKIKKIMFITLLLFAVLTIGSVNAADDIASDNITVSDDEDIIVYDYTEEDEYDYGFDPNTDEEISLDDPEDYIADIYLPSEAKGYIEVSTDKENIIKLDFDITDDNHWDKDYESFTIWVSDISDNLSKIKDGDNLTFRYYEIKNQNPELIDMFTVVCKVTKTESTMTLTEIDDEYESEDVEVDYSTDFDEGVIMEDNWEETELIQITINNADLEGRFEIWINKTIAFNKTLDLLEGDSDIYTIYLKDLNINKAGTYLIESYFYDNNGAVKYNSTDEEAEQTILTLYEPQTVEIDDVSITVSPIPTVITGNETLITVNSSASEDDIITIYVDEEESITIKLNNTRRDEDNNYIIGSKELKMNLTVGEHNINITYKGQNITGKKINIISNIVINLEEDTVYTGFEDYFVFITLKEGEIKDLDTESEGKINLTITDNDGNTIFTEEYEIGNINPIIDEDEDALGFKAKDINPTLNGTYTVAVSYFNGNIIETKTEGNVTFKILTAEDYGTSINSNIKDKNDTVITFTNLPLIDNIIIEIDGKEIDDSYLDDLYSQEGQYYIKYNKLEGLTDGTHKVIVYIKNDTMDLIEIASGEVFVDVEENIDPNLTVTVANIEEGNAANIVITTNTTFSGEVIVQVANTNYTVNVTKGQGSLSIPSLKANTYTATAFFKSDGILADSTKTATFKVTSKAVTPAKPVIKLTLKKVKVKKSAKKLVLKATLKINGKTPKKGTKIKFTFKGKKYTGKTNAKGVAKVTIKKKVLKKLKVGKKVKYTAKYSTKTVKRTVKVKK